MATHPDCGRLLEALSDFASGEAAEALCAEIEAHMAHCENCRIMVHTLRKTVVLYRAFEPIDLPAEVRRRLYQTLDLRGHPVE